MEGKDEKRYVPVYYDGEQYNRMSAGSQGQEMWTEEEWADYSAYGIPWSALDM